MEVWESWPIYKATAIAANEASMNPRTTFIWKQKSHALRAMRAQACYTDVIFS
jgi:hypothetical protein